MKTKERKGLRTWIEIDVDAIDSNYREFRSLIPDKTKICAVVKSNAYGHYLVDFSKRMERNGVDRLAVDTVFEGLRLRKEGISVPLIVLGYTLPEMFGEASLNDISVTISGRDALKEAVRIKTLEPLKIHLKFDTGMNRQGFGEEEVLEVLRILSDNVSRGVEVEGIYTHFANAKDPDERGDTEEQIKAFERMKGHFLKTGFKPLIHACATAGAVNYSEAHYDMVRIGIGMYGLWPSERTKVCAEEKLKLKRVMSWKTVVSDVKEVPAGVGVGYGFSEKVSRDSKLAVLPIGYWHGYSRALSSSASVLIRGRRAKVIGLISMDITVVDVTDIKGVKVGDEVTLIGNDGEEEVIPEELAEISGSSNYEFITRINPLIKKFYL